jgi:hypothetical protein
MIHNCMRISGWNNSYLVLDRPREMENISRGPTFGDFVTILTEVSMQDNTVARLQEYRLPSPPSMKCSVLRESLSVDSQNIPCGTLKRRGSWVISTYISISLCRPIVRLVIRPFGKVHS